MHKKFKKRFSADLDNLEKVRNFVKEKIQLAGVEIDNESLMNILLSVDEAFTNAVLHGCQKDPSKKINVTLEILPETIKISIKDPGKGFIPAKITREDVIKRIKALKRGGLGLYLIYNYMDEVHFLPQKGLKNTIVMIKQLD